MITDSNQGCMPKTIGRRVQEEVIEETIPTRGSYLGIPQGVNILPRPGATKEMVKGRYGLQTVSLWVSKYAIEDSRKHGLFGQIVTS